MGALARLVGSVAKSPKALKTAGSILRRGKKAATSVDDVAKAAAENVSKSKGVWDIVKKFSKLSALGGLTGSAVYGVYSALQDAPETTEPTYNPDVILGQQNNDRTSKVLETLERFQKEREQLIRNSYANMAAPNLPGAEAYDPISRMSNQMGAATLEEMRRLQQEAAADAAAIRGAGQAGAAELQGIYNAAASDIANTAATTSDEYGSMVPVSGELASLPQDVRAGGDILSQYLAQNELISSQDQGFLSELSNILGPAYANQFSMQDRAARTAAEAARSRAVQEFELQRQRDLQEALAEIGLSMSDLRLEAELEQDRLGPVITTARLNELEKNYNDEIKLPGGRRNLEAQGIYNVDDYIRRTYQQQPGI